MKSADTLRLVLAGLALSVLVACSKSEPPAPTTTATATITATATASTVAEAPTLPAVDVPEDYEERAALEVKTDDLKGQVDAVEKEIAADK